MRNGGSLSRDQDLRIHGKPGEGVSPVSAVPESGETVSLLMAGFPGRWLQILLLSHQLYSKHVSCWAGPGEHGVRCLSAPLSPEEEGRGLRLWVGVRHAWRCRWKSGARLP